MENTTTSPETGTVDAAPLSFDEGVSAISNLLDDDPETPDLKTPQEAPKTADTAQAQPEGSDEADEDEPDLQFDDADEEDGEDAKPAPSEVSDETEVTLDDGTKISIGQLKRNNLFQADYSRKTKALTEEKKTWEAERSKWQAEAEQNLQQSREVVLTLAQRFLPQEPDASMLDPNSQNYDPVGYMTAEASYKKAMADYQAVLQQRDQEAHKTQEQMAQEAQAAFQAEYAELRKRLPKFKDQAKADAFLSEAREILQTVYDIDPNEIGLVNRAAYFHLMHDGIQYQKLLRKSKTKVQQQIAATPKLEPKQRRNPTTEQQRDKAGRFQNLRSSGSLDAAARAIESLL